MYFIAKYQFQIVESYPSLEFYNIIFSFFAGTVPYKRLKDVVESRYLLPDVPKLSPVYQTYALEVFHSVVNHFAPKSTHFFYASMLARFVLISVLSV